MHFFTQKFVLSQTGQIQKLSKPFRGSKIGKQWDGQVFAGKGREVDPAKEPDLAAAVRKRMDAKYDWSEGLIVELRPD